MPITSSAKKAMRVAERRHQENLVRKDLVKHAIKNARRGNDKNQAELLQAAQSQLDRAVKSKLMHRNTASRLLSRLTKATLAIKIDKPNRVSKPRKAKA